MFFDCFLEHELRMMAFVQKWLHLDAAERLEGAYLRLGGVC